MNIAYSVICKVPRDSIKYTGRGVGIAFLDTGIFPHKDFKDPFNRIVAFKDFVNHRRQIYDDNGHGTHIAGISSGNGISLDGKYTGIAPESHLIIGKVLDYEGNGSIPSVLDGIRWVIENKDIYKTRILNISVGTKVGDPVEEDSILVQGVNEAWDSGLVVIVAAGNNGPKPMSVTAPGISRKVITVGSSDDNKCIKINGGNMCNYSGRGPTRDCIIKPDIVAPGSNIMSCHHKKVLGQYTYTYRSGTSMATPIVSGAMALLLEKYPDMKNREVKLKLKDSCDNLNRPKSQQGWGQLNLQKLLL